MEKALTAKNFTEQKSPLEAILRALRPLKLKSIDELDLNTRGRMITTLARVARQPKPEGVEAPEAKTAPVAEAAPAESAPVEAAAPSEAPADAAQSDAPFAAEVTATPVEGEATLIMTESAAPAVAETAPSKPAHAPVDPKLRAYQDVMHLVGSIWRSVGDTHRAASAFASSGRPFEEREAVKTFQKSGDWRDEASALEQQKRTRDAAKVHEKHQSFVDAARLYEAGGDLKSALRVAAAGKDETLAKRLMQGLPLAEVALALEKAGAWEWLMAFHVEHKQFDAVAKLYERARQFDQAAVAWERSGKFSLARKAYERAKDSTGAARVRDLEVGKLLERGDRLGAATLQLGAGMKDAAVETVKAIGGVKAFRFLQKLKLDEQAVSFAKEEIAKAETAKQPGERARWLELLGDVAVAAEAWLEAGRADRALALFEQGGMWAKAAPLAEKLGELDKAEALFHRAGDKDSASRVKALPRVPEASLSPAASEPVSPPPSVV
ncbi:MAG: DEAD/DEAH box helicase [Myxococcaceae bacterium]|nr:DEAD/DEAH box helicase [Myxococcaceae bacterium]